jgi:hypothetical protein
MNPLLIEGLTDAAGFVAGALMGFAIASLLGLDPLAAGYSNSAIGGIVLCGLGGGAGVHLARRWRAGRKERK